ncbi:alpha/beta fold hydrolase [Shimia aestuarii]|uniref:Palmitoyl-protein thioesterase ABHD10, mitochondrial n=1 Tax=Shimia aestuarii TaxID=254406 RepID=A0A1I4QLP8_9RHOB|nr:alpha/beta hydrolase [Shimia aestuarii]SFM40998.1 Pimeloyl-ACP methyl ester carboxylesterase [Shimia aestuarii]
MSITQFFESPQGRRIAFHKSGSKGPTVVFLGGLKSDMEGTKAVHLEAWAKARGQAFLRFDYSGHGESSGRFEDGCIGDWHEDSLAAVNALTEGPLVLVGSSMGGWQALLLARAIPERVKGLVTIAAAPDFTEDSYWAGFTDAQKQALEDVGYVELPSDYMEPYVITKRMIEDGRRHLVLREELVLDFPVRFLQGTEDSAVSSQVALRLLDHAEGTDMRLLLVKGKDHRFSDDDCLKLIEKSVETVISMSEVS